VPYLRTVLIDGPYSCEDGTEGDIVDDGFGLSPSDLAGPRFGRPDLGSSMIFSGPQVHSQTLSNAGAWLG
jgi:hypothetical protein